MSLFTVYNERYEPGSFIPPGIYGSRILSCPQNWMDAAGSRTSNQAGWYIAQEAILEQMRTVIAPTKPPRLRAGFAFEEEQHARNYAQHNERRYLYTVEIPLESQVHRGGFDLLSWPPPDVPYYPWMLERAVRYWQGNDVGIAEILTFSPMLVLAVEDLRPGAS